MNELPKINQENKIEKPKIKEGVGFLFEQNPELVKVGTQEQYSQYLDAIFPDSIIPNMVYRGDNIRFFLPTNSENNNHEVYLTTNRNTALQHGDRITISLIDTKNPYYTNEMPGMYWKRINDKSDRLYGHDSVVLNNGEEIIVSSRQIYILGSKQDVEDFKEFTESHSDSQRHLRGF